MSYIEGLVKGNINPKEGQISLEEYLQETIYITKYMSPRIKATNIATYHAMFYLSYGKNGIGSFSLPWPEIGGLCGNERNNGTITKNEAIRDRTKVLINMGCITVSQNRTGANNFYVLRPSEIPFVKQAIAIEQSSNNESPTLQNIDCYCDLSRKLKILERDNYQCVYCLAKVGDDSFFLDHVIARAKGGSNYKNNLLLSCKTCNSNKSDDDVWEFLPVNYRKGLLKQSEYIAQQQYIKSIIEDTDTGEP